MATDHSLHGRLRRLFGLPSILEETQAAILKAEPHTGEQIGTWKCSCGHRNVIFHLPEPSIHSLGLLHCRACPQAWRPAMPTTFTSQHFSITSHTIVTNDMRGSRTVPRPQNDSLSHVYVCLELSCGLSWRTDIETECFSGNKRQILLLGGKRGKLHCDCGIKIFEPGHYQVFEIVPTAVTSTSSGAPSGPSDNVKHAAAGGTARADT